MTGTQRGEFMGIAATGNAIDVSVCDYFRVDNGALIEHWGVMDAAGMMQQLTTHSGLRRVPDLPGFTEYAVAGRFCAGCRHGHATSIM